MSDHSGGGINVHESDFKAAFLAAIRAGGSERERAFSFFEVKLADSFKGEPGIQFYEDFISLVQEADPAALPEARERFFPLIEEKLFNEKVLKTFTEALHEKVEEKEQSVTGKEALVKFLEEMEACSDEEVGPLVERTIMYNSPDQVRHILAFLTLVARKDTKS
jgi:hypothetical protein